VRNGSVTPREEGFVKQTQVMLVGRWYAEEVSLRQVASRKSQVAGALAQALLVKKGASNIYSNFLRGSGPPNVQS
jgi:hypothetical protein